MIEKTQDRVDELQKEIKINKENYQKMVKVEKKIFFSF